MDLTFLAVLAFCVPLILNLLLTPLIIAIANHFQLFDRLNHRKIHSGNISRLGGIGIFLAFALTTVAFLAWFYPLQTLEQKVFWPLGGALLIFGVGLWDDFYEIRARYKLVVLVAAVLLVLCGGFWFGSVGIPGLQAHIGLGLIGVIVTFFWLLGITNAINLIDGMDGLAGGAGFIATLAIGLVSVATGRVLPGILALVLAGALLGFLLFNRPKARIFMGDGGAYFLGFMLAFLPLVDVDKAAPTLFGQAWFPDGHMNIVHAVTLLLIPIGDTFAAILRRARKGQGIFQPDRHHMHHKMLAMGLSTWQILLVVSAFELALAAAAVFDILIGSLASTLCLFGSWVLVLGFFIWLDRMQYRNPNGQ